MQHQDFETFWPGILGKLRLQDYLREFETKKLTNAMTLFGALEYYQDRTTVNLILYYFLTIRGMQNFLNQHYIEIRTKRGRTIRGPGQLNYYTHLKIQMGLKQMSPSIFQLSLKNLQSSLKNLSPSIFQLSLKQMKTHLKNLKTQPKQMVTQIFQMECLYRLSVQDFQ